jgi:twitching motility protein PilT
MQRNIIFRIDGTLVETEITMTPDEKRALIMAMLNEDQREALARGEDVDMCYTLSETGQRQRVNVFHQQKVLAAVIRIINSNIPTFEQLNLPETLRQLAKEPRGLILVTGPTGSGKSTTLAAMVDYINENYACHILTVEDPVEYVYNQKKALIHQRDIGTDVGSFAGALRSAMREDPDVILIGEMRDYDTISAAVTAAETGHLVLSTLHTTGAAATIDRIIDVFPPHNQQQIRTQLASVLKGVVTQTLVPKATGTGRVAAFEIMTGTDAVLNLIRENKCHQLNSTIQTGSKQGMVLLDTYLANLVRNGAVKLEDAAAKANDRASFTAEVQRM